MTSASMVAPESIHFSGQSSTGPVSYLVSSEWAELIFVLWALVRHPSHPQLIAAGWLPPGWIDHANRHGQPVAPGLLPPPS